VLIDDVPYGTATEAAGGYVVPDLDPSDLARIEVLRGPQGTLYGANSMGGLLKYVTLDPSMERFSGRVQLGTSGIDGSDELGYSVRGSVNVPLGDTLAIRASGFTRREPGYIDNPAEGLEDVNSLDTHGGRLAALWRPSESFSLKLSALLQRSERNGAPNVTQGLGDLDQSNLRNTGASVGDYQAYSATVDASLGRADLVAISGYNINKIFNSLDFTPVFGFPSQARFGVPGSVISENKKTEKFTQEVRVSAPLGERIDGLVGVYYANENSPARGSFVATDPATGSVAGTWYTNNSPTSYEEYSAFTNLTFKLTDRFDVQLGGRESYTRQIIDDTILSGPFVTQFLLAPTETAITPGRRSKDHAFTYLFTPRYKLSSDVMAYARFASGYRGGGSNGPLPGARPSFDPDQTFNYELGLKGDLLGKALSIDASVYYIDWKDVQITVTDALSKVSYTDNAGRARSQGVELAIESRPLTGLKVSGWVAWNDATFTDFPASSPVISKDGDRLPFSSRFSGYVSVDQEFPLSPSVTGSVGGALRYVGERIGQLGAFPDRQEYPAYAQTDLRAGLDLSAWAMSVNLFVNNVTDRRGLLSGGTGFAVSSAFTYIQPRTVGLSLARDF
jgi:outer membrane receptor protein involved in Fe transport